MGIVGILGAYEQIVASWKRRTKVAQPSLTVGELCLQYLEYAEVYYRRPDGSPTGETNSIMIALRVLVELFAACPICEFGPAKLIDVQALLASRYVRKSVNTHVNRIRHESALRETRMFSFEPPQSGC